MIERIKNIINPEEKPIDEMSSNEMIELLIKLNKCLRCLDSDEVRSDGMIAGDMVAPTREVQDKVLDYLMNNISKIQDKRSKAAIIYYTLLNLHMFSDGNGRTSRFMYDLISGDLDEKNLSYYFHKDSNNTFEQKNQLELDKGILDITEVNRITDKILSKQLDFIPKGMLDIYPWITVGHTDASPDTDRILPENVVNELSEKELKNLDVILRDGYGVNLTTSGLAMLYVIQKKGQMNQWIEYVQEDEKQGFAVPGRFNISIYRHPERLVSWNADDFRDVIAAGNRIKYAKLTSLINIFISQEKYIDEDTGKTYASEIIKPELSIQKDDGISR